MRVGLDITQAVKRRGRGIANYIRQVVPHIERAGTEVELTLCIRGGRWWRRSLVSQMAPGSSRAWLRFGNPGDNLGLDLFHSFGNHLPLRSRAPRTFTIHDFRSLDRPPGRMPGGDRLRRNIERASGVICLTEHGKNRLLHHYRDFNQGNIAVIPHGVDHSVFYPPGAGAAQAVADRYGLESPFMLQLGSWFPHKNLELAIRAFAASRSRSEGYKLVFVGGGAKASFRAHMEKMTVDLNVESHVIWLENVARQDVPGLLAAAGCLLQPSRYEGFALPVLEAMAVGTPGVLSDSSCLPEVSSGVWPITGQDDIDGFAAGIDAMLFDPAQRQAAIHAGILRAADFSWHKSAAQTIEFFQQILAKTRG